MNETATLSTIIDARVKEAITKFCEERGIKLRYLIEQALIEQLEDEIDLQAFRDRRNEETIPLEKIVSKLGKKKS